MYKLTIKVTKEILEHSKYCNTVHCKGSIGNVCAIALAVREIFPEAWVYPESIAPFGMEDNGNLMQNLIPLPKEARDFISHFDKMSPASRTCMEELEFEVSVQDRVIKELINIDEIKEILKTSKTLELHEC